MGRGRVWRSHWSEGSDAQAPPRGRGADGRFLLRLAPAGRSGGRLLPAPSAPAPARTGIKPERWAADAAIMRSSCQVGHRKAPPPGGMGGPAWGGAGGRDGWRRDPPGALPAPAGREGGAGRGCALAPRAQPCAPGGAGGRVRLGACGACPGLTERAAPGRRGHGAAAGPDGSWV